MAQERLEQCRRVVGRLLSQRKWHLVEDVETFAREVCAEVETRAPGAALPSDQAVEHVIVNLYSRRWHAACGAAGTPEQRIAFEDLYERLYRRAYYVAHYDEQIAQDSAQAAMLNIWKNLAKVKNPGLFDSWAQTILVREVLGRIQEYEPVVINFTDLQRDDDEEDDISEFPDPSADIMPPGMTDELRERLKVAIHQCLQNDRSELIIMLFFLDGLSDKQVAEALAIRPTRLAVLKFRALDKLRHCEALLRVLEELT